MHFLVPPFLVVLSVMGRVFLDAQLLEVGPSIPEMDTENTKIQQENKTHNLWMYRMVNLIQKLCDTTQCRFTTTSN